MALIGPLSPSPSMITNLRKAFLHLVHLILSPEGLTGFEHPWKGLKGFLFLHFLIFLKHQAWTVTFWKICTLVHTYTHNLTCMIGHIMHPDGSIYQYLVLLEHTVGHTFTLVLSFLLLCPTHSHKSIALHMSCVHGEDST